MLESKINRKTASREINSITDICLYFIVSINQRWNLAKTALFKSNAYFYLLYKRKKHIPSIKFQILLCKITMH